MPFGTHIGTCMVTVVTHCGRGVLLNSYPHKKLTMSTLWGTLFMDWRKVPGSSDDLSRIKCFSLPHPPGLR